ncbi:hypothetical protein GA0115240_154718 [Streptomyces sp. DvalAA-14]|nr:hypothetical protein GA0115240_154718 [Streptomyces sp. DvalAA-14]
MEGPSRERPSIEGPSIEGPWRRMAARAPKEHQHHLPVLELRRPSVSADPTEMTSGVRGSRLLDRRPPHNRCPAVPGLKTSARAILMARSPPFFPLRAITCPTGHALPRTAGDANYWWPAPAPLFGQSAPSPVLHLLRLRIPLPNLPVRAPAAGAFTEVLLAAAPDHCGPPGPAVSPVAVQQLPWLRNSTTAPPCTLRLRVLLPGSSSLPGPAVSLDYERNHTHATAQCLLQRSQILRSPRQR